jgi:hypothetical protein
MSSESPDADYARLQRFYASQMQLLDAGRTQEWAATFTDDAIFEAGALEPVKGREAIEAGAAAVAAKFVADGIARRHWIGMIAVDGDGSDNGEGLAVRSYALVLEIPAGGTVNVSRSTVCHDVLAADGASWQVRHRKVTRDDLPAA